MTHSAAANEPLVSIVIVDPSGRRDAGEAIAAVLAQDYSNIECVLVLGGSSDGAGPVVQDPRCRSIRLDGDFGELGGLLRAMDQISGAFICPLGADDILAPSFVSRHVAAHLSLAKPVAFTSSRVAADQATSGGAGKDRLAVLPSWMAGPGGPADGMRLCRRSVLQIVGRWRSPVADRAAVRSVEPLLQALGGSATIDLELSTRRGPDGVVRDAAVALAAEALDFILRDSRFFRDWFGERRYFDALEQVAVGLGGQTLHSMPALGIAVDCHLDGLRGTFGDRRLLLELSARLRGAVLARFLANSPAGGLARLAFAAQLVKYAVRRRSPRWLERKSRRPETPAPVSRPPDFDGEEPTGFGPVVVLSDDPPIIKTGIAHDELIGIAGAYGRRYGHAPAGFLIYPTWSIEAPKRMAALAEMARAHGRGYPSHRLIHMANTRREHEMLAAEGLDAIFLNKNFTVSDDIFRPLPEVEPIFDAIYNARFDPVKRHGLASAIETVAYLGYLVGTDKQRVEQKAMFDRVLAASPGHVLLNPVIDGVVQRLSPEATNRCLNQARIGLCLSEVEGSNYASMEYMLAGLGVVSTPSSGGRDVYFDPDFCVICDPDPDSVRRAVAELGSRNIPRDYIRSRTLERVEVERKRFLDLVGDLKVELGGVRDAIASWPYGAVSGMIRWDRHDTHLARLERMSAPLDARAHAAAAAELLAADLSFAELRPAERVPILRAIAAAPHCRLLIVGLGRDTSLWETANRDGTTVCLEEGALARALPPAIRGVTWDVILLGDERDTAAQLVAPGGSIFVWRA